MANNPSALAKACCSDLYQSALARTILGETRHPGGLRLTNRLGRLMGIQEDDLLVDLAAGNGSSAMAISRTFRCRVVGLEFGRQAIEEALEKSNSAVVKAGAWFVQGDADSPPLKSGAFDAALLECSLSIFPDKARALQQVHDLLKPGGTLGMSDVVISPDCLPPELQGTLGRMLCLTEALDLPGYLGLLKETGFAVTCVEDASQEISQLLAQTREGLSLLGNLGAIPGDLANLVQDENLESPVDWLELTVRVSGLVAAGQLGYRLIVATRD